MWRRRVPQQSDKSVLSVPVIDRISRSEQQLRIIKEALQEVLSGTPPVTRPMLQQVEVLEYVMALLSRIEQTSEESL